MRRFTAKYRLPVVTFLFSLLCSPILSAETVAPRIIGGQQAASDAWPSMVALVRNGGGSVYQRQFCGGNLIGDRWVLTAAHCLFNTQQTLISPSSIRVAAGSTDLSATNIDELVVSELYTHPLYDPSEPNAYHDLAVLELSQASTLPNMPLFTGDTDMETGSSVTVTGWGAASYSDDTPSNFPTDLREVTVPLVARAQCNAVSSYNGIIGPGQLCAGLPDGGMDSCVGDSGGPLMIDEGGVTKQVGIVSFGIGCALPLKFGVYSNVSYYSGWIAEVMNGDVEPGTFQEPDDSDERLFVNGAGSVSTMGLFVFSLFIGASVFARRQTRKLA